MCPYSSPYGDDAGLGCTKEASGTRLMSPVQLLGPIYPSLARLLFLLAASGCSLCGTAGSAHHGPVPTPISPAPVCPTLGPHPAAGFTHVCLHSTATRPCQTQESGSPPYACADGEGVLWHSWDEVTREARTDPQDQSWVWNNRSA